jgi:hypothetical protein
MIHKPVESVDSVVIGVILEILASMGLCSLTLRAVCQDVQARGMPMRKPVDRQ